MGDVIKTFPARSYEGEKPRRLRLCFDTGSPYTFIKESGCRGFRAILVPPKPTRFGGLGDGMFFATDLMNLEVRLLGIWCRHAAYVVPDEVLDERYDLLVGHDFTQKFDVTIAGKKRDVILDRGALKMAQTVRRGRGREANMTSGRPKAPTGMGVRSRLAFCACLDLLVR